MIYLNREVTVIWDKIDYLPIAMIIFHRAKIFINQPFVFQGTINKVNKKYLESNDFLMKIGILFWN